MGIPSEQEYRLLFRLLTTSRNAFEALDNVRKELKNNLDRANQFRRQQNSPDTRLFWSYNGAVRIAKIIKSIGRVIFWPITGFFRTNPEAPETPSRVSEPKAKVTFLSRLRNGVQRAWDLIVSFFKSAAKVVVRVAKAFLNAGELLYRKAKTTARIAYRVAVAFLHDALKPRELAKRAEAVRCWKALAYSRSAIELRRPHLKAIPPARSATELPAAA